MDRMPKKPPFPVGTRLRYVGERQVWNVEDDGSRTPLIGPGLIVTVADIMAGVRGTLRPIPAEFQEDDGSDPILDRTRDACSIYRVGPKKRGQLIRHETAHEWERVV